jgi:4-oxalocrotonate tautomerase
MPIIQVNMLEGRTVAQKRRLHAALTSAAIDALGVPAESVRILIHELAPEHFALAGVTHGELPLAQRRKAPNTISATEAAISK